MKFTEQFLDDLRARVPVSVVAARKVNLKKQGIEHVGLSPFGKEKTPSFTVNDQKRLWKDFSADKGGDVFACLVEVEGIKFPDAVKIVAEIAGVAVPGDAQPGHRSDPQPARVNGADHDPAAVPASGRSEARKIDRTYDYTDAAGKLIYQVVRFVWEKDGAKHKSFAQRRPSPDGRWIWGLDVVGSDGQPLEFMAKGQRDWQRFDADKFADWKYDQRKTFAELGNVKHGLYRMAELTDDVADGRAIWLCEGEKDADTARAWGLAATTNSGGARHWSEGFAELFRGLDVIIPVDNDQAGREGADKKAAACRAAGAKSVKLVDFAAIWDGAPKGADLTDWKEQASGTPDLLDAIVSELPQWQPSTIARSSRFGRLSWRDQNAPTGVEYEWVIKGMIPARQEFAIVGPSRSGKSYKGFDMGMHIALGRQFHGCRVKQGLAVYCMPEGGGGARDRMRAYRKHHSLPLDGVPFEVLTRPFDIFNQDEDTKALIEEIAAIRLEWPGTPLQAVFIDTWSAVTTGLKENASEDVSRVRSRLRMIKEAHQVAVGFIHHMNSEGTKARGHTSITADIEAQLEVTRVTSFQNKQLIEQRDENGRILRRLKVAKQREGEDGRHWDFVLERLHIRVDADGEEVTQCVCVEPARSADYEAPQSSDGKPAPRGDGFKLTKNEIHVFKSIAKALERKGTAPAAELGLPSSVTRAVEWSEVGLAYKEEVPSDEDATPAGRERYKQRVKQALKRARDTLRGADVVGIGKVGGEDGHHVIWLTGRKVWGPGFRWPAPQPSASDEAIPDDGTSITDFFDVGASGV